MGTRLQLHDVLLEIVPNVYFQPPSSQTIKYPCIVYSLSDVDMLHANNFPYKKDVRYQVTLLHKNPDNTERLGLENLPKCSFDRFFTKENLNHYMYDLYF